VADQVALIGPGFVLFQPFSFGSVNDEAAHDIIGLALGASNDDETKVVVIGYQINEFRGQLAAR
jgi:hypothetical protein